MNDQKKNFMIAEFDHVLIELDFGERATHGIRHGNNMDSMEDLISAKADLSCTGLAFIQPYDQLRLYFVTEWVNEFGLKNMLTNFNQKDFEEYFFMKLDHFHKETITISPSYQDTDEAPCHAYVVMTHALMIDNHRDTNHESLDVDI
jgi:hypothetical protein